MTPTVSAYTYLWGQHDNNANPFPPLGCKVKAYLQEIAINKQNANKQRVLTAQGDMSPDLGIFEFEQPSNSNHIETRYAMHHPQFITPFITQDDCDSPPSLNTHQHHKGTLTQDYMLHMMEQPGYKSPFTPQLATGRRYPLQFLCDLAYAVLDDEIGDLLEYRHLMKHPKYKDTWLESFGTEIRRLVTTTETIFFKRKDEIPHDRRKDITYGPVVCTYRSEKKDPYPTRLTMEGNLVNYPDDCGTPTAGLLTIKLLLNSVISTANAKFMTIDIKDFYLMTPMKRYEYFRMKINLFPQDIIEEFDLLDKVDHDGNVFCEVRRGMYGIPQAGIIAQELLEE
jgi:hypothetical protein